MHTFLVSGLTIFMGFFAIMNPIANTPIFVGLTASETPQARKLIAFTSLLIAFIIVAIFSSLGSSIFEVFGITLPAFQMTGGILIFVIGFQMLHGHSSGVQRPSVDPRHPLAQNPNKDPSISIAISPLAMPLLAGPGTLATAMSYTSSGSFSSIIISVIAFGILCIITYFLFIFGEKVMHILGREFMHVITRMMGLILAVIGMQMLIIGIKAVVKTLM